MVYFKSKYYKLKIMFLLCLLFLINETFIQISKIKTIKSFYPYDILEIETSSDIKTIKKAYR